jgi:hypothetical protein
MRITILLCIILLIISCDNYSNGWNKFIELEEIEYVEGNERYTLINPRNIKRNRDFIYISNSGSQVENRILQYSLTRKTILNGFARTGRGPEEILNQNLISVSDDKIFIDDISSRKVGVYSGLGDFLYSFNKPDPYYEFTVHDSLIYHFGAEYLFTNVDKSNNKLIKVSSIRDGKLVFTFGEMLSFLNGMPEGMSMPIIRIHNNKVYTLFKYFPLLRVYDFDGKLIEEYNLTSPYVNYKEMVKINYDESNYADAYAPNIKYLFTSFRIIEDRIFIGLNSSEKLRIEEFTIDGNYVKSYTAKDQSNKPYLIDFEVITDTSNAEFIIAYHDIFPRIGVFSHE